MILNNLTNLVDFVSSPPCFLSDRGIYFVKWHFSQPMLAGSAVGTPALFQPAPRRDANDSSPSISRIAECDREIDDGWGGQDGNDSHAGVAR
jgi:hypothetical protein